MAVRGSQRKSVEFYIMVVCRSRRKNMDSTVVGDGSCWKLLEVYEKCGSSWKFMQVHGSSSEYWTSVDILWKSYGKLLEVYETRGSRWKYVWVNGSSWKLPPTLVVEAATDGSDRNFHFLPPTVATFTYSSMAISTNFHGSNLFPSTSMEVPLLPI